MNFATIGAAFDSFNTSSSPSIADTPASNNFSAISVRSSSRSGHSSRTCRTLWSPRSHWHRDESFRLILHSQRNTLGGGCGSKCCTPIDARGYDQYSYDNGGHCKVMHLE